MKIVLNIIGGVLAAFLLIILLTLVITLDNDDSSHVTLSESIDYSIANQTVLNGVVTVELQNDGNLATFEDWISHFSFYAMGVLEDFITVDSIQEIRIFETSSFLNEDVEENEQIKDVSFTEEMIFDVTITKEKAEELDYNKMETVAFAEPYQLFNQAEAYSIHADLFQNELSQEKQERFINHFEK